MIVTIDGPAGAGKSSAARNLAKRLGFRFLDTGAMYRTVALAGLQSHVDWDDGVRLAELVDSIDIEMTDETISLNGVDVSKEIRTPEVTAAIHYVADEPEVRSRLVAMQRRIAEGADYVSEGRDQGTVAFPDAECKIFLTASPEERAKRRAQELNEGGQEVDWRDVLAAQNERDRRDESRPVGALSRAEDAIEVLTDGMNPEQVVDRLEELVLARKT